MREWIGIGVLVAAMAITVAFLARRVAVRALETPAVERVEAVPTIAGGTPEPPSIELELDEDPLEMDDRTVSILIQKVKELVQAGRVQIEEIEPPIDAEAYQDTLRSVAERRRTLAREFNGAGTAADRDGVLTRAADWVAKTIRRRIIPPWYGTRWDFNGTTEVPRQGTIACGYFVSTVLRDAGFHVERWRLAQQASEDIVRSLATPENVRRFSDAPVTDVLESIEAWGPGVYVVGLDIHVGFLVHDEDGIWFIHSSYVPPTCVIQERAGDSAVLASSRYLVVGKVTGDRRLMEKYLRGEKVKTRLTPQ